MALMQVFHVICVVAALAMLDLPAGACKHGMGELVRLMLLMVVLVVTELAMLALPAGALNHGLWKLVLLLLMVILGLVMIDMMTTEAIMALTIVIDMLVVMESIILVPTWAM